MTRVMAAHQPNFLPYAGFFDKMRLVGEMGTEPGVFVIRDDCQFVRKDFQNRNRIRTPYGWMWLQVPVDGRIAPIRDIRIADGKKVNGRENWAKFHRRMIWNNYRRTPFFDQFYSGLDEIYSDAGESLSDFNVRVIRYLAVCFGIDVRIVIASKLGVRSTNASEALAEISDAVGADAYLSGPGGKDYLDVSFFQGKADVFFQRYDHPAYPQRFPGFYSHMSAIDALFNVGRLPNSGEVIAGQKVGVRSEASGGS